MAVPSPLLVGHSNESHIKLVLMVLQAKKNAEEAARWISNWRSNGAGSNGASSNGSSNGASASKTTSAASSNGSSNGSSPSSKGSAQVMLPHHLHDTILKHCILAKCTRAIYWRHIGLLQPPAVTCHSHQAAITAHSPIDHSSGSSHACAQSDQFAICIADLNRLQPLANEHRAAKTSC